MCHLRMGLCEKQSILNHEFRFDIVDYKVALDKIERGRNGMAPIKFTNFPPEN
jgi:hypothetical protein